MGAKTWMLVLAENNARTALAVRPLLNREHTEKLAKVLFPGEPLELMGDVDLSHTCPSDEELHIGCFPGVTVVAAKEFASNYPSKLHQKFIVAGGHGMITLHAMHSVVDWFAYAIWTNGKLVRSLSLSPDNGIIEDIGQHLPFEEPYWSGAYPAFEEDDSEQDAYPFQFHPLELGETTLKNHFGSQLEGVVDTTLLEPETIPLMRYKRFRLPWWKFWR